MTRALPNSCHNHVTAHLSHPFHSVLVLSAYFLDPRVHSLSKHTHALSCLNKGSLPLSFPLAFPHILPFLSGIYPFHTFVTNSPSNLSYTTFSHSLSCTPTT